MYMQGISKYDAFIIQVINYINPHISKGILNGLVTDLNNNYKLLFYVIQKWLLYLAI